jgi:hypothetical protein
MATRDVRYRGTSREPKKTTHVYKQKAATIGPLACAWAAKLDQQNQCPIDAVDKMNKGTGVEPPRTTNTATENFMLKGEPLYGGKGKSSDLTSNHSDTVPLITVHAGDQPMIGNEPDIALTNSIDVEGYAGLAQPCLCTTQTVILGEDKVQMRCKNKQR